MLIYNTIVSHIITKIRYGTKVQKKQKKSKWIFILTDVIEDTS